MDWRDVYTCDTPPPRCVHEHTFEGLAISKYTGKGRGGGGVVGQVQNACAAANPSNAVATFVQSTRKQRFFLMI